MFRMLPFEGYLGVLAFCPVQWRRTAKQVSKGWKFAVQHSPSDHDSSVVCQSIIELKDFLRSLSEARLVSAVLCDTTPLTTIAEDTKGADLELRVGQFAPLPRISHVTWKCNVFDRDHQFFLKDIFINLKSLTLEFPDHFDSSACCFNLSCLRGIQCLPLGCDRSTPVSSSNYIQLLCFFTCLVISTH